jgi:hypothetical protein
VADRGINGDPAGLNEGVRTRRMRAPHSNAFFLS